MPSNPFNSKPDPKNNIEPDTSNGYRDITEGKSTRKDEEDEELFKDFERRHPSPAASDTPTEPKLDAYREEIEDSNPTLEEDPNYHKHESESAFFGYVDPDSALHQEEDSGELSNTDTYKPDDK